MKLKGYSDIEVFKIEDGRAYISLREKDGNPNDVNNGFFFIDVPYNPREIQLSVRGNVLVDQSLKNEYDLAHHSN